MNDHASVRQRMLQAWDNSHLPPLKCAGCRKCCLGDTVKLQPWEDPSRWKTKLVDGRRVLRKGKDGNCVYLGKQGCRIQQGKPFACQIYDCRVAAEIAERPDGQRLVVAAHPATQHGRALLATGGLPAATK